MRSYRSAFVGHLTQADDQADPRTEEYLHCNPSSHRPRQRCVGTRKKQNDQ